MLFLLDDPAPTQIYTLSLHRRSSDLLLNLLLVQVFYVAVKYPNAASPLTRSDSWIVVAVVLALVSLGMYLGDRKSTRLNSSHVAISYAVFCLKKKKTTNADLSHIQ